MSLSLPLAGMRVLVFENFGAGPFGSMYLADLGAEVIKIENREQHGDASRSMGPYFLGPDDSQYFQTFNLNKKSCALNLKHPLGQRAFRRLVRTADAVMNNLRGDQPEKLGLTYGALGEVKRDIVCAHLSAYGRDNERRGWPGYDYLMQAEAGYLYLTGEPDSAPVRMGLSIVDFMTGITTALAVTAAVWGARRNGRGADIDVSLFDVALHQLSYPAVWQLNESAYTERQPRSAHPAATPVQLYRTADGWIFIMCMTDKFWMELVAALGDAQLATDSRFSTMAQRRLHRDTLTKELDERLITDTTDAWLMRFRGRLPAAPVHNLKETLDLPFLGAVKMIQSTPHSTRPDFRTLANPIKIDGQRLPSRTCSPLGADTESLLRACGVSEGDWQSLCSAGVV